MFIIRVQEKNVSRSGNPVLVIPPPKAGKPMRDHITAATIHDIHKVLRCAFNLAVRWEYISKNPFLNATLPEHHEKERVVLEPEQILKVLNFTNRPEYLLRSPDCHWMYCAGR